jgi:hypothetical protein
VTGRVASAKVVAIAQPRAGHPFAQTAVLDKVFLQPAKLLIE